MFDVFDESLPWYKGNLHTHTTLSDGIRNPEQTAAVYREAGYDFIAITDHLRPFMGYAWDRFIALGGVEYHDSVFRPGRVCHIVGIGMTSPPPDIPADTPPQRAIDELLRCGAWVTLAHPAWSMMHHGDALDLTGYDALEIYSGISDTYAGRGYSGNYADLLACAGRYAMLTAVDDCHYHDRDIFLGFVMVQADEFTPEALMRSLRQGRFYASNGPSIRRIRVGEGRVTVECDREMAHIRFMSNLQWSVKRTVTGPVRIAEYEPLPAERFIRVECADPEGRTAWSQFLALEGRE